ncbi:MAG: hypothetical protein GWN29_04815 [Gammaproteobacteria bacterium]|nr:hypothetical protein [Gammaproteobacteria bacterium]NIV51078.1 hypothetical protein [Gammaproteobacteria bacterium]NIW23927.1 hypothetical protein [Gammaproteobacteria bacterium]NIX85020.1 hypothetical protein [Gammaproteobacteria bacterium]
MGIRAGASASPAVRAALERAIAYWHWEMGREVFRLDPVASVVVEQRDLRAAGRAYTTTREGCLRKARVIISHDSAVRYPEVLESVMRHELGHVLGLRDTPGAGVMDPQLALPDFLSEPHPLEVRVPELLLLR